MDARRSLMAWRAVNSGELLRIPALVVPVSGRAGLNAVVRQGADVVVLNGRSTVDAGGGRDATFGILRPESFADSVEFCLGRAVAVRLGMVGAFPVRRFADILDLAASLAEMGVSGVELSDPGLAAVFRQELPDLTLVAVGTLVRNSGAAKAIASVGFRSVLLDPGVSVADAAMISDVSGLDVELPVFGARPVGWCHACMAGEYLDSRACNGNVFGPCHRRFLAAGGGHCVDGRIGRWLDTGFFSGLLQLPEIMNAGFASVRVQVDQRSSARAGDVTAVFRDAIDCGARASASFQEGPDAGGSVGGSAGGVSMVGGSAGGVSMVGGSAGTRGRLTAAMYPPWAPAVWTGMLLRASMFDDVTPTASGNGACGAGRPGVCQCVGRGATAGMTARRYSGTGMGIAGRLARFMETIAIGAEDGEGK